MLKIIQSFKQKYPKTYGWVLIAGVAACVAVPFRTWLYSPYWVPTGSMIHTIEIGDHLFANKHAYGFAIPFTDIKLFVSKVERNDIIIFPSPKDPSIDFIKRVIAIGGDELEIRGEDVYINGKKEDGAHVFFDERIHPLMVSFKMTIPEGKLWVMGDNRRNSNDSRNWGMVEEKTVAGRASIFF